MLPLRFNPSMNITKPLSRFIYPDRFPIRHIDLRNTSHTNRNQVIQPSRQQERSNTPNPNAETGGDGHEEGWEEDEQGGANPEEDEGEGGSQGEENCTNAEAGEDEEGEGGEC